MTIHPTGQGVALLDLGQDRPPLVTAGRAHTNYFFSSWRSPGKTRLRGEGLVVCATWPDHAMPGTLHCSFAAIDWATEAGQGRCLCHLSR